MGRGRAKAKQTKVARELKYHTPNTDLTALQRELSSEDVSPWTPAASPDPAEDDHGDQDDPYEVDDEDSWAPRAG
jgi:hypothetical protein